MTQPPVDVRRSARRRRTVSAYRDGDTIVVLVPDSFSAAEEAEWVSVMIERVQRTEQRQPRTDDDLSARARTLSDQYFGGLAVPESVRWVGNQHARWGSCTPADRSIRLSERLRPMPSWVVDYVLVHELAHLLETNHNQRFWGWVSRFAQAERAKGYLLGWSAAAKMDPPPGSNGVDESLDEDVD